MKSLIFFILFLSSNSLLAQTFSFPKLAPKIATADANLPKNWKIIEIVNGDLNMDKREDLVMILEYQFLVDEDRAYGNFSIELIKETQKPRMLAIYFKDSSNKYRLALQNNDFILRSQEGGTMGDPLKAIRVEDSKLSMSFEGGNDWRWKLNYEFQYQNKAWTLVNANNVYYHNESGEMVDKQYDFIERTIKTVVGSVFKRNIANSSDEEILVFGVPRTLNDFKKPWTWEVTRNNYL